MALKITGDSTSIVKSLGDFTRSLDKSRKAAIRSAGGLDKLNKKEKEFKELALAASRQVKKQIPLIAKLAKDYNKLEGEIDDVRGSVKNLHKAFKSQENQLKKATMANKKYAQSNRLVKDSMRGVMGGMGKMSLGYGGLATIATVGASYAAVAGIKATVSGVMEAGAAFEYMTTYAHSISEMDVKLQDLQSTLLSIKGSVHTPVELAEGIKEMAKAGYDLQDSLENIEKLSKFAAVGELALGEATALAVTQVEAFSDENLKLADSIDIMAAAALGSPMSFGDLRTALSHTTELSIVAGQKFEDVNAALALMAKAGIKGSKAGTAIRTAINKLISPTEALHQKMKGLGMDFDAFTDAGKVKDMRSLFDNLSQAIKKLPGPEQAAIMKKIFGLRSLKAGAVLVKSLSGGWDEFKESLFEAQQGIGIIERTFAHLEGTTSVQMKQLSADINKAFVESFNGEMVTKVLGNVRDVITDPSFQSSIEFMADTFVVMAGLTFKGIEALQQSLTGWAMIVSLLTNSDIERKDFAGVNNTQDLKNIEEYKKAMRERQELEETYAKTLKSTAVYHQAYSNAVIERAQVLQESHEGLVGPKEVRAAEREVAYYKGLYETFKEKAEGLGSKLSEDISIQAEKLDDDLNELMESSKLFGFEFEETAKKVEASSDALKNFDAIMKQLDLKNAVSSMTELEKVQADLDAQYAKGAAALNATGKSSWEYRAAVEALRVSIYEGSAAHKARADAIEKDGKATKGYVRALESADKAITKITHKIATAGMGEQHKIISKNLQALEGTIAGFDKKALGAEAYTAKVEEATAAQAINTQAELDAADAKNDLVAATLKQNLEATIRLELLKAEGEGLRGMAKLNNEVAKSIAQFEKSSDYKKALIDNPVLAAKSLAKFKVAAEAAVKTTKALIEADRDTQNLWKGFTAGAKDAAESLTRLGEVGYEIHGALSEGIQESLSTTLKNFAYGLDDAKDVITEAFTIDSEKLHESYAKDLADLEEEYSKGEQTVEDYEQAKLDLLESYNETKLDALEQYNDDILAAEEKLGVDLKNIWDETLRSMLDSVIDWAAEVAAKMVINASIDIVDGMTGGLLSKLGIGGGPDGTPGNPLHVVMAGAGIAEFVDDFGNVLSSESVSMLSDAAKDYYTNHDAYLQTYGSTFDNATGEYVMADPSNYDLDYGAIPAEGTWYSELSTSMTELKNKIAPYLGALAGAYGVYSGVNQFGEGNYVGGAVSTAGGASNIYSSMGGQYAGTATTLTGAAGSIYGLYSGISDMMENGINAGNAMGTGLSAVSAYNTVPAAYGIIAEAFTSVATTTAAQTAAQTAAVYSAQQASVAGLAAAEAGAQGAGTLVAGIGSAATGIGIIAAIHTIPAMIKELGQQPTDVIETQSTGDYNLWDGRDFASQFLKDFTTAVNIDLSDMIALDEFGDVNVAKSNEFLQELVNIGTEFGILDDAMALTGTSVEKLTEQMGEPVVSEYTQGLEAMNTQFVTLLQSTYGLSLSTDAAADANASFQNILDNGINSSSDAFSDLTQQLEVLGMTSGSAYFAIKELYKAIGNVPASDMAGIDTFASGGVIGGVLQGGSGKVDDLYLGTINGTAQVAVGGEYIMPPEQTKKYGPVLELMRSNQYADGGFVSSPPDSFYNPYAGSTTEVSNPNIAEIQSLIDSFNDIIGSNNLQNYVDEIRILDLEYRRTINTLESLGASQEDIQKAQAAHALEIRAVGTAQEDADKKRKDSLEDLLGPYRDINASMSDMQINARDMVDSYAEAIEAAAELGATETELAMIRRAGTTETDKAIMDLLGSFGALNVGMSDTEIWIQDLNAKYQEGLEVLMESTAGHGEYVDYMRAWDEAVQTEVDKFMDPVKDIIDQDTLSSLVYGTNKVNERFDEMRDSLIALDASSADLLQVEMARNIELEKEAGKDPISWYDDLINMGATVSTFGSQSAFSSLEPANNDIQVTVMVDGNGIINEGALATKIVEVSESSATDKFRRDYTGLTTHPGVI